MKDNKAIFFDIDGTLLPFGDEIWTDTTVEVLNELKNRGYKLFIATGRHHINTPAFIKTSGIFDGYICLNGQMIFVDDECVHETTMDDHTVEALKKFGDEHELSVMFATASYFHLSKEDKEFEEYVEQLTNYKIDPDPDAPILQATMYLKPEYDDELRKIIPGCVITRWNDRYIDINKNQVSKASGIKYLMEKYNIAHENTYAVGDAGNDREMLKFVGTGIAMGNADAVTKSCADIVIGEDVNDGLKDLLDILK